jgi:hypothetical protein
VRDPLDRFRESGWTLPPPGRMKEARLATGGKNKKCETCGMTCHPIRTACPSCGGTVSVLAEPGQYVDGRWVGDDSPDITTTRCNECGYDTDIDGPCPDHQPATYAEWKKTTDAGRQT